MTSWRTDAPADPENPRARGKCDRCDRVRFHDELVWQMEYRGQRLMRTGILVCPSCLDKPQPQDQTVILQPDPVAVKDPRPEM